MARNNYIKSRNLRIRTDIKNRNWNNSFKYQMLDRMRSDCDHYLNGGLGSEKKLWAGNVRDQIGYMKEIRKQLRPKPIWLGNKKFREYRKKLFSN